MIELFEDQKRARHDLAGAMKAGYKRIILKLPTGGGKTVIAADIARMAMERQKRMLFLVDAISLIDQTVERFTENGIDQVGVIQAMHPATDYMKPIQVASIQTMAKRPKVLDRWPFHIIVVDEAHCQYEFVNKLMKRWSNLPFIGLTATPKGKGMAKHWETVVVGSTIRELIGLGRLSPYRIFAASNPDLKGIRTRKGDFETGSLSQRMQEGALVSKPVDHWIEHGEGRPTLVFCVDRTHAKFTQKQFIERGIPCGYIDAYTEREERATIAREFNEKRLGVVVSVGCLTKGVDWDVRCIVLLRPTKSEMLYLQIIGRGLRTADGKDDCLILDHSDTALRLGFPEDVDERMDELDEGKKPESGDRLKEDPLPKQCKACGFIKPAKVHKCPACGFAPERQHAGDEVDAQLEELVPKAKQKINRDTPKAQKAAFYAGLQWQAREKGYKPGWAARQYKERFGVYPNAYKSVRPSEPDKFTRDWITSRKIAYAKRKQKEQAA